MGSPRDAAKSRSPLLALTALGVVFGDIGTSPLYAMRECFFGSHSVPATPDNVIGVLSLILYALILIISIKYILVVMRADNEGEGGILALMALLPLGKSTDGRERGRAVLLGLGLVGTALLYGDGMITPAISVLGAVEGLRVATPVFEGWIEPISIGILLGIFFIQHRGTDRIGALFGPVMAAWFVTIAILGATWIWRRPEVAWALDPRHGARFLVTHGWSGFGVLGAVFLVVTGGEALYADMGHFGRGPIRLAWFGLVLPSLLINYFGQGALLIASAGTASHPFFLMAPSWALGPLVVLSTCAATIASQALISGSFSLTQQAIQLGYAPRLDIQHTSSREMGQIYVPQVNWFLACATVLIVAAFESSSALAAAYGIAVTATMVITTILLHVVAVDRWRWPAPLAWTMTGLFLAVDMAFFGANLLKIFHGGWLPLVIAAALFTLMATWKTGRRLVAERLGAHALPLEDFVAGLGTTPPTRVPGTAVFMSGQPYGTPPALINNLRFNRVLHEHVIILSVTTSPVPHVALPDQVAIDALGERVYTVRVRYGFMQEPDVPEALRVAAQHGLDIDFTHLTYFLGRETIITAGHAGMALWRERLFIFMARNAVRAMTFFKLPPDRVVELGVQVEM